MSLKIPKYHTFTRFLALRKENVISNTDRVRFKTIQAILFLNGDFKFSDSTHPFQLVFDGLPCPGPGSGGTPHLIKMTAKDIKYITSMALIGHSIFVYGATEGVVTIHFVRRELGASPILITIFLVKSPTKSPISKY